MKDSDNKTILLAVCALGAFWIMSRRSAVAGTVAARPATSTSSNAAGWANVISNGINALGNAFKGSSGTMSNSFYGGGASSATMAAAQQAQWADSNPDLNGSIADYVGGAADGLAINLPGNSDPWSWAYGLG